MSPTSARDDGGRSPQDHPDITGLLTGDASPRERQVLRMHVDTCVHCRAELIDLAVLLGELRDAARHQPSDPADVPPARHVSAAEVVTVVPPNAASEQPTGVGRGRRLVAAAAACILLAGAGAGAGFGIERLTRSDSATSRTVALTVVGSSPSPARGSAHMTLSGQKQVMRLSVAGLPRPNPRDHYEVWLLDTRTGAVHDIGRVPRGTTIEVKFAAPADSVERYNAIDVSLQRPSDGNRHSGNSELRGSLS